MHRMWGEKFLLSCSFHSKFLLIRIDRVLFRQNPRILVFYPFSNFLLNTSEALVEIRSSVFVSFDISFCRFSLPDEFRAAADVYHVDLCHTYTHSMDVVLFDMCPETNSLKLSRRLFLRGSGASLPLPGVSIPVSWCLSNRQFERWIRFSFPYFCSLTNSVGRISCRRRRFRSGNAVRGIRN